MPQLVFIQPNRRVRNRTVASVVASWLMRCHHLVHLSIQPAKEPFVARIFKGLSELEGDEELVRRRDQSPIRSRASHLRKSPLQPMLSAIWKLEMTHRSICLPDFGSKAVWGEGLAWPCPPTWRNPRRDDKSATPCEHGSIGKTKADDALPWVHREKQGERLVSHQIGGQRPPAKPCPPLSLGATRESMLFANTRQ